MNWRDAVVESLHRFSKNNHTRLITRQGLIEQELPRISAQTQTTGQTPEQTLSRILQDLRDEGLLFFGGAGQYILLDEPLAVDAEDLPDDVVDEAIRKKKLLISDVPTADEKILARQRRGQARVRLLTLENYSGRCGFCDVTDRPLIVASHISRWGDDPAGRGDLANVICACRFHDALFEYGYLALADDYRILKKPNAGSRIVARILEMTESFRFDVEFPPNPAYLEKHRRRTGFSV